MGKFLGNRESVDMPGGQATTGMPRPSTVYENLVSPAQNASRAWTIELICGTSTDPTPATNVAKTATTTTAPLKSTPR